MPEGSAPRSQESATRVARPSGGPVRTGPPGCHSASATLAPLTVATAQMERGRFGWQGASVVQRPGFSTGNGVRGGVIAGSAPRRRSHPPTRDPSIGGQSVEADPLLSDRGRPPRTCRRTSPAPVTEVRLEVSGPYASLGCPECLCHLAKARGDRTRTCDPRSPRPVLISRRRFEFG
jgi:hypothetical protein